MDVVIALVQRLENQRLLADVMTPADDADNVTFDRRDDVIIIEAPPGGAVDNEALSDEEDCDSGMASDDDCCCAAIQTPRGVSPAGANHLDQTHSNNTGVFQCATSHPVPVLREYCRRCLTMSQLVNSTSNFDSINEDDELYDPAAAAFSARPRSSSSEDDYFIDCYSTLVVPSSATLRTDRALVAIGNGIALKSLSRCRHDNDDDEEIREILGGPSRQCVATKLPHHKQTCLAPRCHGDDEDCGSWRLSQHHNRPDAMAVGGRTSSVQRPSLNLYKMRKLRIRRRLSRRKSSLARIKPRPLPATISSSSVQQHYRLKCLQTTPAYCFRSLSA